MTLRSYDPAQVVITYGGIIMSGFGEDTMVSVDQDEDDWSLKKGVDGEGTRAKSNNQSATVEITLMQSSPVNLLLSAQRTSDLTTPGGVGGVPFLLADLSGTTLLSGTAWIQKPPTTEFAREATERVWTMRIETLAAVYGGN